MYQALEKAAKKFKAAQAKPTLEAFDQETIEMLRSALSETAEEISEVAQTSPSQMDSANLAKLYQGMLAAKRIIENLHQEGRAATLLQLTQQPANTNGAEVLY